MSAALAILLLLAGLAGQQSDPGAIARQMRELRRYGQPAEALEQALAAGAAAASDSRVLGEHVQALLDLGQVQQAHALLRQAPPDLPASLPWLVAHLRWRLRAGPAETVLQELDSALRRAPQHVDLQCLRISALTRLQRWAQAQQAVAQLPESCPEVLTTHLRSGLLFSRARREMQDDDLLERAVPRLREALELTPERADVRAHLVLALARFHRADQAVRVAAEGLARIQGQDRARVLYALGVVHRVTVRPDEAMECFDQALVAWPGYVQAEVGKARSHITAGRLVVAIGALNNCLEREPDNVEALLALAEAQTNRRQAEPARKALEAVLRHDPANLKALYMLSRALAMQGRREEARAALERYVDHKRQLAAR